MSPDSPSNNSWDSIAAELAAYREQQKQTWGDLDHALIGRYLAGEVTAAERVRVESQINEHPELKMLTEVVGDILASPESVPAETPQILSFSTPRPRIAGRWSRLRQLGSLMAAASLLLALGLVLKQQRDPVRTTEDGVPAMSTLQASRDQAHLTFHESSAEMVALANELVSEGKLERAADVLFKSAPPRSQKRDDPLPSESRPYLETVVQLADKTLDRSPLDRKGSDGIRPVDVTALKAPPPAPVSVRADSPMQGEQEGWILQNSVSSLVAGLQKVPDPELQSECVRVLGRMGPRARHAVPVLEQLAARGCDQVRPVAREALRRVRRPDWIGLRDSALVLSESARKRINTRLRELSEKHNVSIVAETVASLPEADRKLIESYTGQNRKAAFNAVVDQRCRQIGADHALYFHICMEPPSVQVQVGPETRRHTNPYLKGDAVRAKLQRSVEKRELDRGLEEVLLMIEQAIQK